MQTPTIVFTTTHNGCNLRTALYGEVTPERLAKEKAIAKHRCEQLAPQPKKQERPRRRPKRDSYNVPQDSFAEYEDPQYAYRY